MSRSLRVGGLLVWVGIVLLAVNLRPAALSVGPLLDEIRGALSMSSTQAGVLTSLPVVAFAVFGALAPRLSGALGPHRLVVAALLCVVGGLFARSQVDGVATFLALSLLALAGMATANVVMPSLVKLHFPDRVGLLTAVYSTGLAIGVTVTSVTVVPIATLAGGSGGAGAGWRTALLVWALLALVALVPWLVLSGHDRDRPRAAPGERIALGAVARTRLGWLMAAVFGLQSLQAYSIFGWFAAVFRDAGYSATTAGLLLGTVTGISIPLSFVVPWLAGRLGDLRPLIVVLVLCYPVGYLGLLAWPDGAVLWALVVGAGTCTFPLVLALIGLRAHTSAGTAALSGFTQSVGYLISALGPFGVGLLHDVTGAWTVPLLVLAALSAPLLAIAIRVASPRYLEDELTPAPGRSGDDVTTRAS